MLKTIIITMLAAMQLYGGVGAILNVTDDVVLAIDEQGELWEFYGEGYHAGDKVILIWDSEGTPTRYDDSLIDAWVIE